MLLCLEAVGAPSTLVTRRGDEPDDGTDGRTLRTSWVLWDLAAAGDDGRAPTRTVFEPFTPSDAFVRSVVPFWDQFAQSLSPWSPDSASFVFTTASGETRVQRVDRGGEQPAGAERADDPSDEAMDLLTMAMDAASVDRIDEGRGAELAFWSRC